MMIIVLAVGLAVLPFVGFWVGFSFGQRSVRLMPMRTERLQVSDRMVVERVIPEPEPPKAVPVTHETLQGDSSASVPPQFKDMVKDYRSRQGGDS